MQTFSYDKTESGEKTQVGTDKLTKTVISRSQGLTGEIRTTITTKITVDYRGVISTEAEQSAWTETGTGDNYNRSEIATRKIPYGKLEPDIKSAADWVGKNKSDKGESNLQRDAFHASVAVDLVVGLGVGIYAAPALAEGKFMQWTIGTATGMAVSGSVSPELIYCIHKNTTEKIE